MIKDNVRGIFAQLPPGVQVVAATKSRSIGEIQEAIEAGIKAVGENYVQETEDKFKVIGSKLSGILSATCREIR